MVEGRNGQEVRVVSQGSSCFATEQGWRKDAIETQGDPAILPTAGPAGSALLVAEGWLLSKQSLVANPVLTLVL